MFRWLTGLFRSSSTGRPSRTYRRLLNRVLGDGAAAERLIEFEMKRAPDLGREQAIARALDRLEYERSR